jgi:hypothetical protein
MLVLDEAWQILLDAVSNPGTTNEPVTSRLWGRGRVHTEPPARFQFDPDNADVVSSREVGDGRAVAFERGDRVTHDLFGSVDTHRAQRIGRSVFRDRDLRSGNEASVVKLMRKDGDDGEAARLG